MLMSERSSRRRRPNVSVRPRRGRSKTPSTAPESRTRSAKWRSFRVASGILERRRPHPGRGQGPFLPQPGTSRSPNPPRPPLTPPKDQPLPQRLLLHLLQARQNLWRSPAIQPPRPPPVGARPVLADEVAEVEGEAVEAEVAVEAGEVRRPWRPRRRKRPPQLPLLELERYPGLYVRIVSPVPS